MGRSLEQFIRFTTDSVGLERTLRFFHAAAQILSTHELSFGLLLWVLALGGAGGAGGAGPAPEAAQAALLGLRQRLNLTRRLFRVFRFVECFNAAHKLYARSGALSSSSSSGSNSSSEKNKKNTASSHGGDEDDDNNSAAVLWLDVFAHTFNGMYLLLETSTTLDALDVPGLAVFTPDAADALAVEGMRFWLFALVCGAASSALRLLRLLALAPAPASGEGYGVVAKVDDEEEEEEKEKGDAGTDTAALHREQERLRGIVARGQRRRGGADDKDGKGVSSPGDASRRQARRLARAAAACALDVAIPGAAVGWLPLSPAAVGAAMLVTTLLTGADAWERCGREVDAAAAAAGEG